MVEIMDLIRSWIMHLNHIFSSYWVAVWSNSLIFFSFFFCHYFMYPNNNLHRKLAVSELLNNVSLSLSFWGPYSYIMCTFFFLAGCIMCTNGWRKKNFLQNRNFYIFYTLLHDLLEVKTIFFTQLVKRLPLSAATNNWFNRQRCHIGKFYPEFSVLCWY